MRKNVKNDSVIRAITLGIAGMMTLTATVGAFPMQAMAAEPEGTGNGSDSTTETTETTTETKETTETTVTPDDANRTEAALPITDGDNHQINVEKKTEEQYVVNDGEATKDQSVTEGKVEDYITVETTVEAETHHVVVAETPNADGTETTTEIVSGVTADGEVVEKIEVDGEDVAPEQVNIITKEETVSIGEGEEATTKTIVEVDDEALVYGYFDENGLFQEDAEKNNENTKAYVVDVDGTYQETANVISYKTEEGDDKEEKTVYITGEYEPDKLTVEVVHTVTGADGKEHIVAVSDNKEADYVEGTPTVEVVGKEEDVTSTETYQYVNVLERGEVAAYKVYKIVGYERKHPIYGWDTVSKEEYDRTDTFRKKVEYNYTEKEIEVGNGSIYATHQWGEELGYRTVDINGTKYYVEDNQEWTQEVDVMTGNREVTTTVTKYYAKDAEKIEFEVSSDQVTTVTKYNLEYNGETIETGLTLEQKNAVIDSIEGHKYVAVNQDKYAIEIPDPKEDNPKNTKRIYLNTDQVSVLTTHDVTFTETKTHYYVDKLNEVSVVNSSEAIIDGVKGLKINGEEYLVEVSFMESTYVKKPVIKNTQFSYIKDKSGNIIGVKVVVKYAVNDDSETMTFEKDIALSDFSASNIAKLTVNPDPVVIKSGVSGYTFVTEKTTMDIEVPTTEIVEGSDGTTEVDAGLLNDAPTQEETHKINHIDVRIDANVEVDGVPLKARVSDIKIVYDGCERTWGYLRQEERNVLEKNFTGTFSNDKPVTIMATVTYKKDGKEHSFTYSTSVYMKNDDFNVCRDKDTNGFDFVISATDIKSAIEAYERETTTTETVVISSDETGEAQYMSKPQITFGGLQGAVSQKNLIVKTYVRLDDVEQKENGTTHYPTDKYTPALSQYLLKYSSAGYDVYGILDENGNLQKVHSDKPYPGEDRFTQEDAISLYLSQEDAKALEDLAKDYANRGTIKDATETYVNKYVDDQIAKLKEDFIAAHPEWDPDEIVWTLTDDDIAKIKQQAIDSARVHWYVLKYEKDNYHIDGVMMIDEITIELNGEVEVIPPTVVPTPDPEPNPGPTPPAPAPGPGPTEPTPGPAPTEPEPTPAPTPVVLGVNRAVETAQAVAPAEEGAVLGARRADGGSVLGASRTKAVLGARRGAQTGDVSGIAGSVSALFASAFAGIGYVVSRRKKKEEDK